jgi:hypothetical protein
VGGNERALNRRNSTETLLGLSNYNSENILAAVSDENVT